MEGRGRESFRACTSLLVPVCVRCSRWRMCMCLLALLLCTTLSVKQPQRHGHFRRGNHDETCHFFCCCCLCCCCCCNSPRTQRQRRRYDYIEILRSYRRIHVTLSHESSAAVRISASLLQVVYGVCASQALALLCCALNVATPAREEYARNELLPRATNATDPPLPILSTWALRLKRTFPKVQTPRVYDIDRLVSAVLRQARCTCGR